MTIIGVCSSAVSGECARKLRSQCKKPVHTIPKCQYFPYAELFFGLDLLFVVL